MSTSFGSRRLVVGAHYGLRDWLAQRITSLLMALFTIAVVAQVLPRSVRLDEGCLCRQADVERGGIHAELLGQAIAGDVAGSAVHEHDGADAVERLEDRAGIAELQSNLGTAYRRMGRWDDALAQYNASLMLRERIGNSWGVATK